MRIAQATTPSDYGAAREILVEYAESLGFSLCFQGFDRELDTLETLYSPPSGALLLAREGDDVAGCVALKALADGACEMRRLYVRPAFRGTGLGRTLALAIIDVAKAGGFERMKLHTLPRMERARAMYPTLGFVETGREEAPEEGIFMSLELRDAPVPSPS